MDIRTGKLYSKEEMERRFAPSEIASRFSQVDASPDQMKRKKIGRNSPCPCSSGKKFKKCCLVPRRME